MDHITLTLPSCKGYSLIPLTCWAHRPGLQGQQTLQHINAACGAYGGEQSQITFLTRTGYLDNDYIILCSHKYGLMLLESIVIALK